MDKVGIALLAIVVMLAWVGVWIWFGLFGVSISGRAIDPISTYARSRWHSGKQWLKKPRNAVNALQWTVRIMASAAILFAYNIAEASELDAYRGEIAGISFTVLVIEEVGRLRSKLGFS